ncbi:MAG: SMI1/KNR4 family protein [Holophagales bacterium]|nr:SMI1/KNR4 family protein [Holophagales bacterium]
MARRPDPVTIIRAAAFTCLSVLWCSGCLPVSPGQEDFSFDGSDRLHAVQLADEAQLVSALERIRGWHESTGTGLRLNPPLGVSELEAKLAELPCQVPDELLALWQWRDGESTEVFTWYHRFLSVDEALAHHRELTSRFGWPETWVPFFEFQEEWYFMECTDIPVPGAPVGFYLLESGPEHASTNLTRHLETLATALEEGALPWAGEWWGEENLGRVAEIHRKLNPRGRLPYVQ